MLARGLLALTAGALLATVDAEPCATDPEAVNTVSLVGVKSIKFTGGLKPEILRPKSGAQQLEVKAASQKLAFAKEGDVLTISPSKCAPETPTATTEAPTTLASTTAAATTTTAATPSTPATTTTAAPPSTPATTKATTSKAATSGAISMLASAFMPARAAITLGLAAYLAVGATAQSCDDSGVTVEMAGMAEPLINVAAKTGFSDPCPAETMYWEHEPDVFGGYKGCVAENGLLPCAQDGFSGLGAMTSLQKPYTYEDGVCKPSGYTLENTTLWILWGHPMDKKELVERTGQEPVVSFPLSRMPYPSYLKTGGHGNDAADMESKQKAFLEYLGAFTKEELTKFDVFPTEGAEQGMIGLWGYMALKIAMTTCNRNIPVFNQVPSYGYDNGESARLANKFKSLFLKNDGTMNCTDDDVKLTTVGWAPGTPIEGPYYEWLGADNKTYLPTSTSPKSPWMESLVFPENPSGALKTVKIPDPGRRVCDGVYLYPTYFGHLDASGEPTYTIPKDLMPECDAWAFSITKIYSAAVRAGTVLVKNDGSGAGVPADSRTAAGYDTQSLYAAARVFGEQISMKNGLYSKWSWYGQMQIFDIVMEKPLSDPTSWVSAYSALMKEKWDAIIDGFKDCPVVEITNPHEGAYAYFRFKDPYHGAGNKVIPGPYGGGWFTSALGVLTTNYAWGWRGASSADWPDLPGNYYGSGYTTYDFQRMQLYRDLSVYQEVARRAKIVCGGGSLPGLESTETLFADASTKCGLTYNSSNPESELVDPVFSASPFCKATSAAKRRALGEELEAKHGKEKLNKFMTMYKKSIEDEKKFESECAPHFTMDCVMEFFGRFGHDTKFGAEETVAAPIF